MEFSPIFQQSCDDGDYYDWMPWDEVSIECTLHHLICTAHIVIPSLMLNRHLHNYVVGGKKSLNCVFLC